jgi:hypothetical protein
MRADSYVERYPLAEARLFSISSVYGQDGRGSISKGRDLSFLKSVKTGSGAHPTSYSMDVGGTYTGGWAVGE